MKFEIINPSDACTMYAPDLEVAAVAVSFLGDGKYPLEGLDDAAGQGVPAFLFGGHDEWFSSKFGMSFQDADYFNAINGNQFIADLMPKHPVYIAMLSDAAKAVIGVPHPSGRAAMRMLEEEGFAWESYIDIFDGGPTMTVRTDQIRSIREAQDSPVVALEPNLGDHRAGEKRLVSIGRLAQFRTAYGWVEQREDGIALDPECAALLGVEPGMTVTHVARW